MNGSGEKGDILLFVANQQDLIVSQASLQLAISVRCCGFEFSDARGLACGVRIGPADLRAGCGLLPADTPGYAMKAVDRERAFGAVLGRAMQPLAKGEKGLVLVRVALQ